MAALGIQGNGESGSAITEEAIDKTLKSLENDLQRVGYSFILSFEIYMAFVLVYPNKKMN